jgi:putative transposase
MFRPELDEDAIGDIRLALNQGQPLGDSRFLDSIEKATGQRREVRPRGRPRKLLYVHGVEKAGS